MSRANLAQHSPPTAILHPNGCVLARVFHGVQRAYVVVAPWDRKAIALASEWFADLARHVTSEPYDFMANDAKLVLQRRRLAGRRAA